MEAFTTPSSCARCVIRHLAFGFGLQALSAMSATFAQVASDELRAPRFEIIDGNLNFTIEPSLAGRNYQLQCSDSMAGVTWTDVGVVRSGDGTNLLISTPLVAGLQKRFYRIAIVEATPAPAGFSLISAGSFQMGDQSNPLVGSSGELPVHSVYVSAFYMGKYEVTKELWDEVRDWGLNNGYTDLPVGNGSSASQGANHPVHSITWYGMVKWCNARSEQEGLTPCYTVSGASYKTGDSDAVACDWNVNGYRLPTEAEWEKAARGGLSGKNFPWGDTINHSNANYLANGSNFSYDTSPYTTYTYHPTYAVGGDLYSSPVGSFAPNGYGLYDMAGNMNEWCWDWYGSYSSTSQTDPRGAASSFYRMNRGGSWRNEASGCRVASRNINYDGPGDDNNRGIGFRVARSSVP